MPFVFIKEEKQESTNELIELWQHSDTKKVIQLNRETSQYRLYDEKKKKQDLWTHCPFHKYLIKK